MAFRDIDQNFVRVLSFQLVIINTADGTLTVTLNTLKKLINLSSNLET